MDQRREFVDLAAREDANISQLCASFGISRKTGYKWLARFRTEGHAGLCDRSRRPHTSPHRTAPVVEAKVLAAAQQHPVWGARKLAAWLANHGQEPPSPSTVHAILTRHGQQRPATEPVQRHWQRFEAAAPNEWWQMDWKSPLTLRQGQVIPLAILDDHSRYALHLSAGLNQRRSTVEAQLTATFQRYGLPRYILTDNGPPWGTSGQGGLTALEVWLLRLGIQLRHGRPYHPQTQGKVERFHRTLSAELLQGTQFADQVSCQTAFDHWRWEYNHERPHRALDLGVPAGRYQPSERRFPHRLPAISYGPDDLVRAVNENGRIAFGGRKLFISRGLIGMPVAVRPTTTDGLWTVHFCQREVRTVDLRHQNV